MSQETEYPPSPTTGRRRGAVALQRSSLEDGAVGPASPLTHTAARAYEADYDDDDEQTLADAQQPRDSLAFSQDDSTPLDSAPGTPPRRSFMSTSGLADGLSSPSSPVGIWVHKAKSRAQRLAEYALDDDDNAYGAIGAPRRGRLATFLAEARAVRRRNEGFLLIGSSAFFFALMAIFVKVLEDEIAMPVWELIAVRMSLTWLGCYIYMRVTKVEYPLTGPPEVRLLLCARGVIGFGGLASVYQALKVLSVADATVLTFLSPVLTGILASLWLGETYTYRQAIAGGASLFGTVLIAKPSFIFPAGVGDDHTGPGGRAITPEERMFAVLISLVGVVCSAGAYLTIRKIGTRASAMHSIAFFSIYCVLVSCTYGIFGPDRIVIPTDIRFVMMLIPIGILGFVAQALLTLGLQREKAARGTLASYVNLLFVIIFEWIAFHRLPDALSLVGATIIVGGAIWVALADKTTSSTTSPRIGDLEADDDDRRLDAEIQGLLGRDSEEQEAWPRQAKGLAGPVQQVEALPGAVGAGEHPR